MGQYCHPCAPSNQQRMGASLRQREREKGKKRSHTQLLRPLWDELRELVPSFNASDPSGYGEPEKYMHRFRAVRSYGRMSSRRLLQADGRKLPEHLSRLPDSPFHCCSRRFCILGFLWHVVAARMLQNFHVLLIAQLLHQF